MAALGGEEDGIGVVFREGCRDRGRPATDFGGSLGCMTDVAIACGWTVPIGMLSTGGGCGWRIGLVVPCRGSGCKSIALFCAGGWGRVHVGTLVDCGVWCSCLWLWGCLGR